MGPVVTEISFPLPGTVLGTCNGLILFQHNKASRTMHVVNPLTKQTVTLPRPGSLTGYYVCCSFSLAYVHSKGEHKVVCTYRCPLDKASNCVMLTLGKDHAWKLICRENFSTDSRTSSWQECPHSTGEFIYWAHGSDSRIVALDVESEIFYEFPSPEVASSCYAVHYSERGKSLSFMVTYLPGLLFDVQVLSDPISGEWKKFCKIDLYAEQHRVFKLFDNRRIYSTAEDWFLTPIAWVKNGDVLIFAAFQFSGPYIAFDAKTGKPLAFGSFHETWNNLSYGFSFSLVSWEKNSDAERAPLMWYPARASKLFKKASPDPD